MDIEVNVAADLASEVRGFFIFCENYQLQVPENILSTLQSDEHNLQSSASLGWTGTLLEVKVKNVIIPLRSPAPKLAIEISRCQIAFSITRRSKYPKYCALQKCLLLIQFSHTSPDFSKWYFLRTYEFKTVDLWYDKNVTNFK